MRNSFVAFLPLLLLLQTACSSESAPAPPPSPPPETEQPPFVARPVDATQVASSCHALANTAPLVGDEDVVATRPPFVGGTIEPGLYYRVRTVRYVNEKSDAPEANKREKQTLRILADGTTEVVHANEGAADDPTSFALATTGSELRFSETCPTARAPQTILYTATATELSIARGDDAVIVYRRQ